MKVNEIKRTQEVLVRTEYVAEDGTTFRTKEECEKYEESALFAIAKKLKRLTPKDTAQAAILDSFSEEDALEIYQVDTDIDLENLRRYLYLKLQAHGASEKSIMSCFKSDNDKREDYVFDGVTAGHEVMIFFSYDGDWFWVYGDGSIKGFCDYITKRITACIASTETKE